MTPRKRTSEGEERRKRVKPHTKAQILDALIACEEQMGEKGENKKKATLDSYNPHGSYG